MPAIAHPLAATSATGIRVREVLAAMTVDEKADLLAGADDWHLRGVPRLGIPSIRVTDCGHGVSLCGDTASPATCLPTGIGMAATWNSALIERAGQVVGRETRALGCSVMLGPKINLHRHPLNGRSFETFSEDPHLAGMLGGALIRGIQAQGVAACVKAVTANNQQRNQGTVSSEVDERTLRELYLRAFEIAIAQGVPAAIMTSYNKLNGDYTSESAWLIRQVIKNEWGFPGFIVSDWRAVHGPAVYGAGLDLEMPGPGRLLCRPGVLDALARGDLDLAELDDKAGRLLAAILHYGRAEDAEPEAIRDLDTAENREVALAVAEESIVLLKNRDGILPLDPARIRRVLVVGPNAATARLGGGGSASVTPFYAVSPLDGIRELAAGRFAVEYLEGCSQVGTMEPVRDALRQADGTPGLRAEYFNHEQLQTVPDAIQTVPEVDFSWGWAAPCADIRKGPFSVRFTGSIVPPVSGRYRLGIHAQEGSVRLLLDGDPVVDAWDLDGGNFEARYQTRHATCERDFVAGRPVQVELTYGKRAARAGIRLEWEIPGASDPIARAAAAASAADVVVLCAGLSNVCEGGGQDRSTIDLPEAQLRLIAAVSSANPRTIVVLNNGGPLALPFESSVPAILEAWYPGQEGGRALARILFGLAEPGGRLPDTLAYRLEDHAAMANYPGDGATVVYAERWAVGYRHFEAAGIVPHYPFGFGLGYTTWSMETGTVDLDAGGNGNVRVRVRNTGQRAGSEVVQLYIAPPAGTDRPRSELRGFRKVHLEPGAETTVELPLEARDFAWFDPSVHGWRVDPGTYGIRIGRHANQWIETRVVISQPMVESLQAQTLALASA
jgi:beta-glucosidase